MAFEIFTAIQEWLTFIILLVAAIIWYKIRKERDVTVIRSYRIFNVILLLALPFLLAVIKFIPADVNRILQSTLFFLIFFALFIIVVRENKRMHKERTKDMEELLSESQKHPIRYEFARRIVLPEIQKLRKKEEEMKKQEIVYNNKIKEIEKREAKIKEEIEMLKKEREAVKQEEQRKSALQKENETKEREIKKKEEETNRVLEKIKNQESELKSVQEKLAQKEKDLEKKYELTLSKLRSKKNEELTQLRAEYKAIKNQMYERTKRREDEFGRLEKDLERREQELRDKIKLYQNIDKITEQKNAEMDKRREALRKIEEKTAKGISDLRKMEQQAAEQRHAFKQEVDTFKDHEDEVREEKEKSDKKVVRSEKILAEAQQLREEARMKEQEAQNWKQELDARQKDLEREEVRIAKERAELGKREMEMSKKEGDLMMEKSAFDELKASEKRMQKERLLQEKKENNVEKKR